MTEDLAIMNEKTFSDEEYLKLYQEKFGKLTENAEKNKRKTDKMNKLIKGLSDEQLETLIQMTESKQESNIVYEK